ncbi:DUF2470 domain-containing protein [Rhodococcus sp. RS1C4]|uniref:DUF2470 domain-containing protein n=1 Tax=Nocardiaceae TaxID=85025 RepID=UPI00036CBF2A|nr:MULTISPECIES: DUF2470 domain-containing protein [Rhodococcus]OZC50036.1 DUF2470 domain-containing protein [Rhodococcus sp. 06-621-2]OZC54554.1 DUF2470 domain-containing protein [Rhodococcus sp. RS1C4]OZC75502.1 DUF2470 domain-containing protein [Rhodococcus sp. 06-418-1B]OZD12351.1 DUF2470 domain-containing protein [Rhodococcus sp. 06-156-3C]OZD18985.1 DUF2470 domain-containing protein [Rhodococcus sp. 06-156-4C]
MIGATTTGPSTAERVRSACARAEGAALAIEGSEPVVTSLHHLRSNGEVVLAVPSDSATGAIAWQSTRAGVPAVLELTDHAPLALREPVRSLVWLRGELRPVPESLMRPMAGAVAAEHPHPALLDVGHSTVLLRLILTSAVVADSTGAEPVAVDDLLSAEPDPFWEMETSWLQHLDEDHADLVNQLARRLPPSLRQGRIRPLGIDRYGIRLRIESDYGDNDVRLGFAEPVDDTMALSRALRVLAGCPFLNGLRARG